MPKNILYICSVGEKGGAEVVTMDIATRLDPNRYKAIVACLKPGPMVDELRLAGIRTYALASHDRKKYHEVAATIISLARIIAREHIDLIHCTGASMLLYAGLATILSKVPVIWHVHDPVAGNDRIDRFFRAVQKKLKPAFVIFNSPVTKISNLETYRNLQNYDLVFPAVDVDFIASNTDTMSARTKYAIAYDTQFVAMFARMQHVKGHFLLVDAAKSIVKRFPNTAFLICGGSLFGIELDYPAELQKYIDSARLTSHFRLTGYLTETDKLSLLKASDIVVHPAQKEPFGLSVIEGMAAGKPVVATDCAGPSITVEHGKTGYIVPRGDAAELAGAIEKLLNSPELRGRMGRAGQRRASERYDVKPMVEKIQCIYDQVLTGTFLQNIA